MPTGAVMLLAFSKGHAHVDLHEVRDRLLSSGVISAGDFIAQGPIDCPIEDVPRSGDDRWIDLNLNLAYFDEQYPRGDITKLVCIADCCNRVFPRCEVWYGHDVHESSLRPFPESRRRELLAICDDRDETLTR